MNLKLGKTYITRDKEEVEIVSCNKDRYFGDNALWYDINGNVDDGVEMINKKDLIHEYTDVFFKRHYEKIVDTSTNVFECETLTPFDIALDDELHEIAIMLKEKNKKYGNSALEPIRIFSQASPTEQILVRLDDKLSRLKNQSVDEDEDVVKDLIGYLLILRLAQKGV